MYMWILNTDKRVKNLLKMGKIMKDWFAEESWKKTYEVSFALENESWSVFQLEFQKYIWPPKRPFLPIEILTCVALSSSPMNHHGSKLFLGNEVGEIVGKSVVKWFRQNHMSYIPKMVVFVRGNPIISGYIHIFFPPNKSFIKQPFTLPCRRVPVPLLTFSLFHGRGIDHQIKTPFGTRKLVYSDFTASGRALGWVEAWCYQR